MQIHFCIYSTRGQLMKNFDYSFLHHLSLPQGLISLVANIDLISENLSKPAYLLRYKRIQRETVERSVQAIQQLAGSSCLGYRSALEEISIAVQPFTWTPELYFRILASVFPDERAVTMAEFPISTALSAYKKEREASASPLLLISCLTLDVICTFPHASWTSGLLLARTLLEAEGYSICKYISIESNICKYFYFYHQAYVSAADYWEENGNEYLPFIEMFLSLLYLSLQELKAPAAGRQLTKRARIEKFVQTSLDPISKAEICAALPDISPTTVEAALGAMVKNGSILRLGATRGAKYVKASQTSEFQAL